MRAMLLACLALGAWAAPLQPAGPTGVPRELVAELAAGAQRLRGAGGVLPKEALLGAAAAPGNVTKSWERCVPGMTPQMYASSPAVQFLLTQVPAMYGYYPCSLQTGAHYCTWGVFSNMQIETAACVPSTCAASDLDVVAHLLLGNNSQFGPFLSQLRWRCDSELGGFAGDTKAQATAGLLTAIAGVCALCTAALLLLELVARCRRSGNGSGEGEDGEEDAAAKEGAPLLPGINSDRPREAAPSLAERLCACWDIRGSLAALSHVSPPRATGFLNGMRVLSIMWVILGHDLSFPAIPNVENRDELMTHYAESYRMVLLPAALFAVDTFFFMSGFLASFLLLKRKAFRADAPKQTAGRVLMVFLDRYVRLTPLYAIIILSAYNLLQYMVDSPFASSYVDGGMIASGCGETWWRNLLYINFRNDDLGCLGHSWYLGNDMVFLLVGLPFVVLRAVAKSRAASAASVALPVAALVASVLCVTMVGRSDTNYLTGGNSYFRPYNRAAPYFYGMLTAFALADEAAVQKIKRIVARPLWRYPLYVFAAALLWGCASFQWVTLRVQVRQEKWGDGMQSFHQFFYHMFWGMGLAVLAMIWSQGHGGWITGFLSWSGFEPLGRVTYGVYLVHPLVFAVMKSGMGPVLPHYSDVWLLVTWVACCVGSYLGGAILFVFIERPVGALWDMASGRSKRRSAPREAQPAQQ